MYQGRISVLLGTLNELDYKLRLAKYVLLNEDGKGCSPTDTGMLDLSHLSASSSRKFRFAQGEPTLPSGWTAPEEPAAPAEAEAENQPEEASGTEPDTEGAEAAPAEDPTAQRQNSNKEHLNDETGTTVGGRVLYAGAGQP